MAIDELQSRIYGFDFRGPASSEMLNQFAEDLNKDLGALIATSIQLKSDLTLLAGQSLKQSYAIARRFKGIAERDSGTNCQADLTDASVIGYTEQGGGDILLSQRMDHRQQYGVLTPPMDGVDYLSYSSGARKYLADGTTIVLESVDESGSLQAIPAELAIAGLGAIYYERLLVANAAKVGPQEFSYMVSVPPSRTGSGYPLANFISFVPFPMYTSGVRVYYTTDLDPTISVSGSNWVEFPFYVESIHNDNNYIEECGPIFTSFPQVNVSALRIDVKQEFYLQEGNQYVYSSGLGVLNFGLMRPTSSTAKAVVRIDKPSGNFTTLSTVHVTFDNVDLEEQDDFYTTSSWIDPGDPSIAYVEITVSPEVLIGRQIPIITGVSVDYV
jgi:hypothetical protein